jgi:hypothetical protein
VIAMVTTGVAGVALLAVIAGVAVIARVAVLTGIAVLIAGIAVLPVVAA